MVYLQSSEFFDSILSMEKDGEGKDNELAECGLSTYSDSGLSSELNTDQLLSDEELFSVCSMLEQTTSSDGSDEFTDFNISGPVNEQPQPVTPAPKPAAAVAVVNPIKQSPQPKIISKCHPRNTVSHHFIVYSFRYN